MGKQTCVRDCLAKLVPVAVFLAVGLSWAPGASAAPPPNDDFANAESLVGLPTSTSGTNIEATLEPGEPPHGWDQSGNSVWYSWTAPASGGVGIDLVGSDFDTLLAVYTGSSLGTLSLIESDVEDSRATSAAFPATSGGTYWIAVDGWREGQSGSIELAIYATGSFSGTITDDLGNPLEGICVTAYDRLGLKLYDPGLRPVTDSSGRYLVDGLAPGDATASFRDCGSNNVAWEIYNDKKDWASADPIAVTAGSETVGIDAELTRAGSISGTVTDSSGQDRDDACIVVSDSDGHYAGRTETDADGYYAIGYLDGGDYRLHFGECDRSGRGEVFYPSLIGEYYNDKPDLGTADPVAVADGVETSGIDVELAIGGSFSGKVNDSPSGPVANTCVFVYDQDGNPVGLYGDYPTIFTDSDGTYTVQGLPTGQYRAGFGCGGEGYPYPIGPIEYYDGKPDLTSATPILVTNGVETQGIDFDFGTPEEPPPVIDPPVIDRSRSAACLLVKADLDKARKGSANASKSWLKARMVRRDARRKLMRARKSVRPPKVRKATRKALRRAKRKARRARGTVKRTNQAILVAEDVVARVCG